MTKNEVLNKMIITTAKMDELTTARKSGLISGYGYNANYSFLNNAWRKYNEIYCSMD